MSAQNNGSNRRHKRRQHSGYPELYVGRVALRSTVASVASPIIDRPDYLERLACLTHSKEVLATAGYVTEMLSAEALDKKKRCSGCGKTMPNFRARNKHRPNNSPGSLGDALTCDLPPTENNIDDTTSIAERTAKKEPVLHCKFHSGQLVAKVWSCCGNRPTDPPCTGREFHIPRIYGPNELERLWQYHETPGGRNRGYRVAVALDCEMGTAKSGDSELIRVTLMDYISGQVLVDNLVYPDVPMLHFNTRYSGVRAVDIHNARRAGTCFFGRDSARKAVLEFVGPSTIVIGHSAQHDLTALRWIHLKIIDTYILESARLKKREEKSSERVEALLEPLPVSTGEPKDGAKDGAKVKPKAAKGSGPLSLKTLAKLKLGREIQVGRDGHDSVEDALAARDLVHAYLTS